MKTNSSLREALLLAVLLLPFVYVAFIWGQLPTQIVTHYGLSGKPDGWMPKEKSVILTAVFSIAIYLLLRFLQRIDPKGWLQTANYQKLRFVVTALFATMIGWMWYMAGHQEDTESGVVILLAMIGLMFAGIGNYSTAIRPNWFVGIRTPWTLDNEVVWRKTHQLAGRLWVVGGLLSAMLAVVVPMPYTVGVVAGIILIGALIPVVYSYVYFQQEKAKSRQLN